MSPPSEHCYEREGKERTCGPQNSRITLGSEVVLAALPPQSSLLQRVKHRGDRQRHQITTLLVPLPLSPTCGGVGFTLHVMTQRLRP